MAVKKEFSSFEELLQTTNLPVLVDFYATWCGPCKAIAPFFNSLKEKYPSIKFFKLDIDENQEMARKYKIESIPAFILFKDGLEEDRLVGANKVKLEEMISKL
jgi:thioredoxin 1